MPDQDRASTRPSILVADDNQDNLYMLETLLKGHGYRVTTAANGADALAKMRADSYDMVIADILMPVLDGFQLCRECKKDPRLRKALFVFYTATYTDKKDEELASALGADMFIRKPIEPEKFVRIVADLLGQSHRPLALRKAAPRERTEVLQLYNMRLVEKLENKMLDLEMSQTRYRNLWENVSDLIFALDERNHITDINHCREMLGYEPRAVIGRDFMDLLTSQSQKEISSLFDRIAKKQDTSRDTYEVCMTRNDGATVVVELGVSSVYSEGRFVGRYGIARDITKRKDAEKALRKSAAQLSEQKKELEQKNAALREILSQIEAEKAEIQKTISTNINRLVIPLIRKAKQAQPQNSEMYLSLLETRLHELTSEFGARIVADSLALTPRQIEICNMIRDGLSSKEIAALLHVSLRTVETHRNEIRKKLRISHKDANLSTYLQSLE